MKQQSSRMGKQLVVSEPEQDHIVPGSVVPFNTYSQQKVAGEPLLLRSNEAAALLNISTRQVQKMCKSGELPCRYFGRSLRVPKWAVLRYVEVENLQEAQHRG